MASDGWGKQQRLVEGLEDVAEGAITVELKSTRIREFDDYMTSLTPENNVRNPWFEQYWEDTFGCVLQKNVPLVTNDTSFAVCDPDLRLSAKAGCAVLVASSAKFAKFAFGLGTNRRARCSLWWMQSSRSPWLCTTCTRTSAGTTPEGGCVLR